MTEMFSLMLRFQPMTAQLAIGCVYFYAVLLVYWLLILVFWPMSSMFSDLRPWFYASQLDLGIELSWCWVHHLKVSKFRKQIVLYSFEPKDFCPKNRSLGQKYFVRVLFQMRTSGFAFEIYWPLESTKFSNKRGKLLFYFYFYFPLIFQPSYSHVT